MTTGSRAAPQAPPPPAPLPVARLAGVFGGLFLGYLGLMSVIPVLPGLVRERYAAPDLVVGLAVTAPGLTALLMRPIAGRLADRHGYRLVMQVGAAILVLGGVGYFLPLGLPGLVVDRLLLGVGEAALFTAGAGWVVSLSPRERRGQAIGLYGVSMWGGISLGTALGAVLVRGGYPYVWLFSLAAPLAALALLTLLRQPPSAAARGPAGLLLRPAALPGLGLALGAAGYAGLASFIVLHLQRRDIPGGVAVLVCFSAVYAGSRLLIGHWPDRYGARRVAVACGVAEAAGLLVIAVAPNLVIALLGSIALGAGFSLLHPSLALMVMDRTDPAHQGAAIGAYTSFWDLGLAVWGPLTGAVATGFGYPMVFVAAAVAAVAAAAVAQVAGRPGKEVVP